MVEAGVRFGENLYVSFSFDIGSGDMEVYVEMIDNEGETHEVNGMVEWEG